MLEVDSLWLPARINTPHDGLRRRHGIDSAFRSLAHEAMELSRNVPTAQPFAVMSLAVLDMPDTAECVLAHQLS